MNSQEFRQAARTTFALAMDAYYAVSNDNDATMEQLIAADVAKTAADAQWIADQHTANTMAQAELDAATAKGCEEAVEVVAESTNEVAEVITEVAEVATTEATTEVAFGTAWGTNGEVLSHEQTAEAINDGRGWFYQGRWVNKAGWDKEHAYLTDWLTAKLAAN
jgi:hypothetical protein